VRCCYITEGVILFTMFRNAQTKISVINV